MYYFSYVKFNGRDSLFTVESAAHWCLASTRVFLSLCCPQPWLIVLVVTSWPQASSFTPAERERASCSTVPHPFCPAFHGLPFGSPLWSWQLSETHELRPQFPKLSQWQELPVALAENRASGLSAGDCSLVGLGRRSGTWIFNRYLQWLLSLGKFGIHCSGVGIGDLNTLPSTELRSLLALVFQPVYSTWPAFS